MFDYYPAVVQLTFISPKRHIQTGDCDGVDQNLLVSPVYEFGYSLQVVSDLFVASTGNSSRDPAMPPVPNSPSSIS